MPERPPVPEHPDESALLARIDGDWSIIDDLARLTEAQRRRILRPHQELTFGGGDRADVLMRRRLDVALDRLLLLEAGLQSGVVKEADYPFAKISGLVRLLGSGAFTRYLTTYLYFGVFFFAERVLGPPRVRPSDEPDPGPEINDWPPQLPTPPPLDSPHAEQAREAMGRMATPMTALADSDSAMAVDFLDDYVLHSGEQAEYELWLRGLTHDADKDERFSRLTMSLVAFAESKAKFYLSLEDSRRLEVWESRGAIRATWCAKNPLSARLAVYDYYLLARLLRAEVSPGGVVSYADSSWLTRIKDHRLAQDAAEAMAHKGHRPTLPVPAIDLTVFEEVLRAVFDFTSDLIQNAVQIARARLTRLRDGDPEWPPHTVAWRDAYDEELAEITQQRQERRFDNKTAFSESPTGVPAPNGHKYEKWSRRIRTGEHVEDLIGLALSGGGIRSATFNLGVLQRLQQIDLLRNVDYLSTVSGGGYIGAWLLANVRRTRYWLSRATDWTHSIEHLRRYSNYLAPRTGLMSADTWSMWGTWVRNALLIQLTAVTWVAVLLVLTRLGKFAFGLEAFDRLALFPFNVTLGVVLAWIAWQVCFNLKKPERSQKESQVFTKIVLWAWVGSFLIAAMIWGHWHHSYEPFSTVIKTAWRPWFAPLVFLLLSFWVMSWYSVDSRRPRTIVGGMAQAAASVGVVYVGLCGLRWLFGLWGQDNATGVWRAYVAGPPLVLLVMTLAVIVIIGLVGRDSKDWRREWWTRLGAWQGIVAVGFLLVSLVSSFGPWLVALAFDQPSGKWSALIGWIATVVGGLITGNSSRSDGEGNRSVTSAALGWFAKVAAFLFIVGTVLLTSAGLQALLVAVWTDPAHSPTSDSWTALNAVQPWQYGVSLAALLMLGLVFSWRFEINVFGLNQFYRNRLVRCYLGATRWIPGLRKPHRFTGFDPMDDIPLSHFRAAAAADTPFRGPFPIVNCALNLGGSSDLSLHTRHSASFVLTPLRSGADRRAVGYARAQPPGDEFAGGVPLGQAISVSGAAASPNMGYSTSPLVAVLLTMFNVRLAWWFPNPGKKYWNAQWLRFSLWYLVKEMFGAADERNNFINVSDGGHFDNLGIYELVRRRCKVIIASDAECDDKLAFGSLGRVVRMCETDFGARIDIDVESIRPHGERHQSRAHCAVGRITYANGSRGCLIYLKSSMTGDEDISVEQYKAAHPAFPHESTGDQFFAEDQFESYRRLGHHIAGLTFRDVEGETNVVKIADILADLWVPDALGNDPFVAQTAALDAIWERFRSSPSLHPLWQELTANVPSTTTRDPNPEELAACLSLFQLMENAFLALRLDDFWMHPDNRGWSVLFGMWAKSPCFRAAWQRSRLVFGSRFVHFCAQRFGM